MAFDLEKIDLGSFGINEEDQQQVQLNANMNEALKVNPDQHAQTTKLSKESGVPTFAVESNPEQVQHKLKLDQINLEGMSERAPGTAKFLTSDVNNSIIAQEDVVDGVLEGIERTFRGIGRSIGIGFELQGRGLALTGVESMSNQSRVSFEDHGRRQTLSGFGDMSNRIDELIPSQALPSRFNFEPADLSKQFASSFGIETDEQLNALKKDASDRLIGEITELQKERKNLTPEDLNIVQEGVRAGVESLANMAPGLGLAILSGGRAAPLLLTIGAQTFSSAYGESRADGLTPEEARWFASIDAAIEVGTEILPTGTLERMMTGESKGLKKDALKFVVQEMGTEQLATALQTVNSFMFGLDKELENAETAEEVIAIQLRRQAVTAIATIVAGGAQITAATAVNKTINKLTETEQNKETQGDIEQRNIDALNADSAKSKLRERDVESFKQFVRDADGENNTHVYIDAVQTSLYLQGKTREEIEADPALKALSNAARESRATGADVAIPVDEFAGDIVGTDTLTELRDSMTMSDETVSPFRQEQHRVETEAYVETLMAEAQENASEYVEAQEIYTSVRDQLIDTGAVNAANASVMAQIVPAWATAQARRSGRTVAEVYELAGLSIEGHQTGELARLEGEQVLSQARVRAFHGTGTRFDEFDESRLGTFTGAESAGKGFFFTSSQELADQFRTEAERQTADVSAIEQEIRDLTPEEITALYEETGLEDITPIDPEDMDQAVDDIISALEDDLGESGLEERTGVDAVIRRKIGDEHFTKGETKEVDLQLDNPLTVTFDPDAEIDEGAINNAIDEAQQAGNDGVIFKGMKDAAVVSERGEGAITSDVFFVFDKGPISQQGDIFEPSIIDRPKNLAVVHNISEPGLVAAEDLGGLAAPSIAITNVDKGGFTNFGEVSLIADPSVLDDPSFRTFDADIYSARQPRSVDSYKQKELRKLTDSIEETSEGTGLRPIYDIGEISDLDKDVVFNYWLTTVGKAPKLKKVKPTPLSKAVSGVEDFELADSDKLRQAVADIYKKHFDDMVTTFGKDISDEDKTLMMDVASDWFEIKLPEDVELRRVPGENGVAYFKGDEQVSETTGGSPSLSRRIAQKRFTDKIKASGDFELDFTKPKRNLIVDAVSDVRKVRKGFDERKYSDDIAKKNQNKKLRADFKTWLTETYADLVSKKQLFKGYTPAGDRKYAEYTLNNVVREMTQTLQGGEGTNYGVASVRSRYANELSTKEKVQAARDQFVTSEEMDVIKEESAAKFEAALEQLKPFYKFDTDGWGYGSDVAEAITEGPKAVREVFGSSPEAKKIIDDLGKYLSTLPTEYFETKVQRAMQLSEFDTAVVPKDASKDAVQRLKSHGLKIRRYDPDVEGSRNEVVSNLSRLLFQEQPDTGAARGYYDPANSVIRLTESADLSTFLHEFAHFMYEMEAVGNTELNQSINNWYKRNADEVAAEATKYLNGQYDPLKQGERSTESQQTVTEADVVNYLDTGATGSSDKDAAVRRAVHEQFARGFETYLMEGKAPSIELRNAFRTFARWLGQIYQALRGNLNVKLDAEMRQVFDRLLATEEQIAAAESRARVEPMFTDAAMAGMTEDEFSDYQKRQEKVKDVQTETLRDQMIKVLTRKTRQWWKEEKADLADEELTKLRGERVYTSAARLRDGDLKLDHATVKEMAGEERTNKLGRKSVHIPGKLIGMTAKGQKGVHPDEAAAFFGYNSGSEMLADLMAAPPIKETAEVNAEARMIERHGDVFTDGTIERQADEAVQNEERGKLILHELRILARGTNQRTLDAQTMKSIATERIGNLSFREIHPGKYRKAEINAAQESSRMLAEGNKEGAAQAKTRQALNYYLGMAATEAKNETVKIVDRMNRYNKKKVREEIMKADGGYWDQIVKILERFEFKKTATLTDVDRVNQDINTWARERMDVDGDGLVLHNAVLNESYVTHWKNVAYSDLQGINDSVKNIEHVARYANKLTRMGEEIEFNKLVDRWVTSMEENVKTRFKSKRTDVVEGKKWGRWLMAQMTKIPFMASWLDGGERTGISHQVMVQPFTDAYNAEIKLWEQTGKPVMDLIEGRSKADMARHNRKIYIPAIDDNLYGHQILAVALNTGNAGNLRKLLLGEKWADPDVDAEITLQNPKLQAVLSHMTESDWQMVQSIWDQMETLYPQLAEVHRRTTGLTPPKVESTPVETRFGTFKGGYYPVKYDPNRSIRAAQNEDRLNAETESMFSNNASIQTSVNTGSTNERTGFYDAIRLSLDVVPAHFQETIHYITHHDPVREINRLTRDARVAKTIKEKLGPEEYAQLKPWLNDIAKDGREAPTKMFWDDILQRLRFGVTLGAMGFKASTGIIQISGLSNTIAEVGMANTMQAMRSILGSETTIKQAWDFAIENSKVLEHRAQTMDREIKNAMKRLESKRGLLAATQEASMKHIALIQTYMVDLPSWHAAYIKGMKEWGDETRSFQYADWVIENVQGSGATKDLAKIMRGQSETGRMFTMFMTFFSSLWNMERDLVKGAKSGAYSTTTLAAKAMFLFTVPVLFEMMMRGEFAQDDDDDESLTQKMLTKTAMYPVQSVPFIRDVANAVTGDFGYNISPMQSIIEQGTRTIPQIVSRGFTDEEITKGQVKGATKFIGAAAGIPGTGQAWASGEHLYDVIAEGEEFTMHQLLFGPERK